ncbi:MAG: hypothetical protein IJE23_03630 [Tyzzerella sp.]|nr:hypothetical protein [Tyzzerella sp.]
MGECQGEKKSSYQIKKEVLKKKSEDKDKKMWKFVDRYDIIDTRSM